MNIRHLVFIVISMFVFQTSISMADTHQFHQSGIEHLGFNHSQIDHQLADDRVFDFGNAKIDCHHCCHCHGVIHVFLIVGNLGLNIQSSGNQITFFFPVYRSLHPAPENPPPIA
jgi:hypothetical protein